MENEKDLEKSNEEADTSENSEVVETDTEVVEEDTDNVPTVADYEALKQKNKALYERAKKAEEAAKKLKATPTESNKSNEVQSGLTREEAILYAKGYTDEEVELANKLAKLNGTNPLKAIEDDIFKAKVNSRMKKEKAEQASLGASSGSGTQKPPKPVGQMTREEHEAYYKKTMGIA